MCICYLGRWTLRIEEVALIGFVVEADSRSRGLGFRLWGLGFRGTHDPGLGKRN